MRLPGLAAGVELGDDFLGSQIVRLRSDPQRRDGLQHFEHCGPHRRKCLIQIRRHFGQIVPLGGLHRQAQTRTDLIDLLDRLLKHGFGRAQGGQLRVDILLGDGTGSFLQFDGSSIIGLSQRQFGPCGVNRGHIGAQQRDLVVDVFDRVFELESGGTRLPDRRLDLIFRHVQIRSGHVERRLLLIHDHLIRLSDRAAPARPLVSPGRCRRPAP